MATGAFGSFTMGDNGIGVKTGGIGPGELAALAAMKDNSAFPTLINGRFESPFMHQAAGYNNTGDLSGKRRQDGQYFDPKDEGDDFDKRFPTAWGKYAMSVQGGQPIFEVFENMSEEMREKAFINFWKARGDLHQAGFSHNDMHGGNIMVDPETGEVGIIDLGLAEDDPFSALMEAAGGFNFEEGEDYQLTP